MKVEVDQNTIDKLLGKRVAEFNKRVRDLEAKLQRRDNKIRKLERELEQLKADIMSQQHSAEVVRIAQIARALVAEMENANWVKLHHGCEHQDCCDCKDYY